jgi:DNA polymerase-3 subunit gamma/tau
MLTKEAFNALLKTLEEPPPHAIFILATTESNKLPDTIISRTQRFDFRPFSVAVIIAQLKSIAKSENISITDDGLVAIAELSDGGMRDAISLLDQLSVLTDTIDASAVQSRMGLSSTQQIEQIVEATASGDTQLAIDLLTSTFDNGVEPSALCAQMQRFLRNILLQPEQPKQKKSAVNKDFAIRALEQLQLTQAGFKVASQRSLPLEIAIVKLSRPIPVLSTAAVASAIPAPAASVSAPPTLKPQTAQTVPASPPAAKPSADLTARCAKGLSIIKENNNSLYALLRSGNARIEGSKMIVDCRFNFHKERIEEFRNREMIEKIMTKVCEREIMLSCVMMHGKVEEPVKEDEELVSSAMAILGGELLDG